MSWRGVPRPGTASSTMNRSHWSYFRLTVPLLGILHSVVLGCTRGSLDAGWNRDRVESTAQAVPSAPLVVEQNPPISVTTSPPSAPVPQPSQSAPSAPEPDAGVPLEEPPIPDTPMVAQPDAATSPTTELDAGTMPRDAGPNADEPLLPVGPSNALILSNDGPLDNWQGEYALLFAQAGGPPLVGIVVGTGRPWPNLDENLSGWQELVASARASGFANVPDPIPSENPPLQKPADGLPESTVPNASAGARFIVDTSLELATPDSPVVVATGGSLTDVADAYLLDPGVADRIVVVASLGTGFSETDQVARMGVPNGEMDTWADTIVVQRLRYVQVSAYYDPTGDVPADRMGELPDNPFGERMRAKQPGIWQDPITADQVSVIALALPAFALGVERVSHLDWVNDEPTLAPDANGSAWLVTSSDGDIVASQLWEILNDPATFGP